MDWTCSGVNVDMKEGTEGKIADDRLQAMGSILFSTEFGGKAIVGVER